MKLIRTGALFTVGGTGYVALELAFRGRSHASMFLAGGVCFLLLGLLDAVPRVLRPVLGAALITAVELTVGLVFNRDFGVWDYRARPGNFLGQICPLFTLLWGALSVPAGALSRYLRVHMFKG